MNLRFRVLTFGHGEFSDVDLVFKRKRLIKFPKYSSQLSHVYCLLKTTIYALVTNDLILKAKPIGLDNSKLIVQSMYTKNSV